MYKIYRAFWRIILDVMWRIQSCCRLNFCYSFRACLQLDDYRLFSASISDGVHCCNCPSIHWLQRTDTDKFVANRKRKKRSQRRRRNTFGGDNLYVLLYCLTFRRLISYIYIYIYIYIYMEHPFLMFLDHTQRRSTVGRTPLDE